MANKTCPACGTIIDPSAKFCPSCGKEVPVAAFCAKCGSRLNPSEGFCPKCGQAVGAPPQQDPRPSPPRFGSGHVTDNRGQQLDPGGGSNKWAWALVALSFRDILLAGSPSAGCIPALIILGLAVWFLTMDVKEMKRSLNAANAHREISDPLWVLGGLVLLPAYLYRRANMTNCRYGPFIASIPLFLVEIVVVLATLG